MKCYANRVTTKLINTPPQTPVTVNQNGPGVRILPDQSDRLNDSVQEFKFITLLVLTGGVTSPTGQIVIQGSVDGITWVDLVAGTSRTATGTYVEALDSATVGLLPWVRAQLLLAGGTNFGAVASVDIVSTGGFQLSSS